ncbi:DLW-39 family protein [Luteimicrobium sp. NPDC057192]
MKKLLLLLIAAGVGIVVWRKLRDDGGARDLWAEVTDTFE